MAQRCKTFRFEAITSDEMDKAINTWLADGKKTIAMSRSFGLYGTAFHHITIIYEEAKPTDFEDGTTDCVPAY